MKFLILCAMVLILVKNVHSLPYCEESSCGIGPAVRFPFRLKDRQPQHCGYPRFELSCTHNNQTFLELPNSLRVYVNAIDYISQVINISHLDNCFQRQARNISLSGSPFEFYQSSPWNFTLFNCSESADGTFFGDSVGCLSDGPGYEIYAVDNLRRLSDMTWLISCTKMYNVFEVPYYIFPRKSKFSSEKGDDLKLKWSEPGCGKCEAKGGRCELKSGSSYSIICTNFTPTAKGILMKLIISGVTTLLLSLLFAAVFLLHRSQKEKESQARIEKFLQDYEALTLTRYSYSDLKRITDQFKVKLGQGAYGEVFKGKISNELLVAVKMLKNSIGNGDEFINEVATLGTIHHVNVVRLVGFCAEGFYRAFVYEFLPNDSLEKFIFSSSNRNSLGWKKLQDIALGIAKGIEYLHQGCDQRILHFDVKPDNILLDENFTPKIADFGLCKLCSKDQSVISMTNARGTMGYIAPEVFSRNFGNVSYKSDVYSYGMLLLEIVGGRKSMHSNKEEQSFPEWIYDRLESGEELEEGDAQIVRKLTIVGVRCIQWNPVDRPAITTVVQMLEGEGNDLEMPPDPFASNSGIRNMEEIGITPARPIQSEVEIE